MSTGVKPTDKLSTEEKRALLAQLLQKKASTPKSYPLSFAQQRLWILDQLEPGSFGYNLPTALRLAGQLDVAALERAMGEIVRRHEVLRTSFPMLDGQPIQLIAPPQPFRLPIHDLADLPDAERAAETRRRVDEEAERPFDLARGPLLRAQLLRLADDEHVLLLTMHHIITDDWSISVFIREMGTLYEAFAAGRPSPLDELPIQYADFAVWQRQHVQGTVLDTHLAYWQQHLGSNLPILVLPVDRPRPAAQTFRGSVHFFRLLPRLSEQIRSLSQRTGATLFMTLLAAFKTLLYRYSGQQDIVVGTLIAGRNRAEIEGLIGFFLNTLALRSNLSGNPSYRALLAQVRETTLGAYAHQDLPVEKLIEVLQPERNLSHNPLFQVMFVLQNTPAGDLEVPGLTISSINSVKRNSAFDITLYMSDLDQGMIGSLEYSTDLFDATTIARMARQFQRLLEGIATQPDQRLLDLPLLSVAERQQFLVEWNDTLRGVRGQGSGVSAIDPALLTPDAVCLHTLIEEQAARTPDAVAIVFDEANDQRPTTNDIQDKEARRQGDKQIQGRSTDDGSVFSVQPPRGYPAFSVQLTYAELDRRANQLAWHLRALGVGPDVRAGICVARSPELVIGLLGILKAGGAYIPLDPTYPAERLAFMLEDSRARVLITNSIYDLRLTIDDLEESQATIVNRKSIIVNIDADWPQITRQPAQPPASGVGASNLAYVIYTSGSTGTPKGVMVQHRSLVSYTGVAGDDYAMAPTDRVLQFASISWNTSAEEIYPCLAHGATLVLRPEAMIDSIATFLQACRAYGITVLNLPTAFWHELTSRMRVEGLAIPRELRLLIIGGERALAEQLRTWQAQVGSRVRLVNTYGATEATAVSALCELSDGPVADALRDVPIGRAIGNIQIYLLDQRMQPVPIGVAGELHLGGAGLARGYLGRPDLTAERFIPNPFGTTNDQRPTTNDDQIDHLVTLSPCHLVTRGGDRLYRTGDLARYRPDGTLEYLDRSDQQVKLRGFRIELGEIEAALMIAQHQGLDGANMHIPRQPRDRDTFPLSSAQQRLWFLDQFAPDNPFYNLFSAWRLSGDLNVPALARAMDELVQRHEALRTRFVTTDGLPAQAIIPALRLGLPLLDLRALAEPQREPAAQQLGRDEVRRPFDLARGPLLRVALLRLGPHEHILFLTIHHIISDGWSTALIVRELATLYAAFVAGQPSPLPELPIQYVDFAVWQRAWLAGSILDTQLAYWKAQLANLPTLDLPGDYPRPAVQSFRGARHQFALPTQLYEALRVLGLRERVTSFMALLAAFDVLLARYSGQNDIVVGTPIANRHHSATEQLIGFFVNTLVLRADLSGDPTVRELLGRVRQVTMGAYAHQDLPFERLVEELQPERDLSRTPLFQVMFVLHNIPAGTLRLDRLNLTISDFEIDSGTTNFDVTFNLIEAPQQLYGWLNYNSDVFEAATIARLVGHFQTLLEGIVGGAAQCIWDVPLLTEAERRQLTVTWNATQADYPLDTLLHTLVEAQAQQVPDATAVVYEDQQLSSRALNDRAGQLAHYLRALGVGPEVLVAVCLERSVELVIALLGVLKAGGAYVPLDPTYPQERIAFMVEDSGARIVLATDNGSQTRRQGDKELDDLRVSLSPGLLVSRTVVDLRADWPAIAQQPATNLDGRVAPDQLAYVIYTSGSTGHPKGAMNTHRGIVNRLLWMQATYALDETDRVLQKTPFSFDVSVWEFFWPLMTGAALVLARPGGQQDPRYLARLIDAQGITTLHFVPSMLQVFVDTPGLAACRSVKRVICSGEALPFDLQERFFSRLDAELHNLYGPTEAAIDVTAWACSRSDDRRNVPIGRPVANTQIYLLDRRLQPVPVGVPGELYIGGVQLARGYLHRPDLTAARFIPNPFATTDDRPTTNDQGRPTTDDRPPKDEGRKTKDEDSISSFIVHRSSFRSPCHLVTQGGRLYKTGDLARYRPDGSIEFLGRRDGQVKVRGVRIELGEIEAGLRAHPNVAECAVLLWPDTPTGPRLVAYVVAAEDPEPTSAELNSFLCARLPEALVPSLFVPLPMLPLTPSGKLDRRALPGPDDVALTPEDSFVAPRTQVEEDVARIWSEVLGLPQIGIHDNFFALGGHSLLMTQIVSRLWATFDVEVPIQTFFEDPTVAGLALKITQMRAAQHDIDTISQLLEQIDQMSSEDLQVLLGQLAASAAEPPAAPLAVPPPAPVTQAINASERYRCAAIERIAIGDQQELLYSRHSRTSHVMPAEAGELLERCRSFKTLDEHARDCAGEQAGADAIADMRRRLAEFASAGLLLAEGAFLDQIASRPAAPQPNARIAAVGFPTSDRLPALQRALTSYIEQRQRYERAHDLVVVDDARRADTRDACRQMLAGLQARHGVAIRYAGLEEKISFAQKLIAAGDLPPDIVHFALFGEQLGIVTTGANRNALLLDTVGDMILSVDDDTVCRLTAAPVRDDRLALAARQSPEMWVFPNREALLRSVPFVEADVLALHEQLLGKDPRDCIAAFRAGPGLDLAQADGRLLQRLESGAGRVVVSLNGILGDCGWGWPANYLFLSGASFERLTSSEAGYRAACTSREILQVAPQPLIAEWADDLMTTFCGLDNRSLVPPFLTIGRGSDAIFGMMLSRCFNDSYFGYLPWALLHMPLEPRTFWPGEITRSASGISIVLLMTILIHSFDGSAYRLSGAEGLRSLGRHIEQLARLPEAEFEEFLRLQIWRGAAQQIAALEELLRERGAAPAYWANDLKAYIGLLRQSLNNRELALPLELLPGRSLDEARALRQQLTLKFGELFSWWPAIMETARGLRAQGHRLSRPIDPAA